MRLKSAHGRIFALVVGLAAATAATAMAQDTSAVKNPPGYSGMERDTTMVPPSATVTDSLTDSTKMDSTKSDSTAKHGKHTDSTKVGDSTLKKPEEPTDRLQADSVAKPQ
ncbi:MAG: hypothetical protein ACAI18_03360 [Gemmatimonadales bacterium]